MEMQELTEEEYKNGFLKRRAKYTKQCFGKGSLDIEEIMADAYLEECSEAASGDAIAMDLLSYWFKHGNQVLEENIETSMKWLFLAGKHGNTHSITKLQLFFNYAYDYVLSQDYSDEIIKKLQIYKENYQEILGVILCNHLCEELNINTLDLAKERTSKVEFNTLSMQRFTTSLNRALTRVDRYFNNFITKN